MENSKNTNNSKSTAFLQFELLARKSHTDFNNFSERNMAHSMGFQKKIPSPEPMKVVNPLYSTPLFSNT